MFCEPVVHWAFFHSNACLVEFLDERLSRLAGRITLLADVVINRLGRVNCRRTAKVGVLLRREWSCGVVLRRHLVSQILLRHPRHLIHLIDLVDVTHSVMLLRCERLQLHHVLRHGLVVRVKHRRLCRRHGCSEVTWIPTSHHRERSVRFLIDLNRLTRALTRALRNRRHIVRLARRHIRQVR